MWYSEWALRKGGLLIRINGSGAAADQDQATNIAGPSLVADGGAGRRCGADAAARRSPARLFGSPAGRGGAPILRRPSTLPRVLLFVPGDDRARQRARRRATPGGVTGRAGCDGSGRLGRRVDQ